MLIENVIPDAIYLKEFLEKWLDTAENQEEFLEITSDKVINFFKKLKENNIPPELICEAAGIIGSVKINDEGENIFDHNQDIEFSIVELIGEGHIKSSEEKINFNGKPISKEQALNILEELGVIYTTLKIALIFKKKYDDSFIEEKTVEFNLNN